MDKYILDTSGISKMLELAKSGRNRKVARLYYVNRMATKEIADLMGYAESVIISEIMVINRIIENNISHKTCVECGNTFYTDSQKVRICPNCKVNIQKERTEQVKAIYKVDKKPKPKAKRKFKSLYVILRELEKYNKNNNTRLSYGEYVSKFGG